MVTVGVKGFVKMRVSVPVILQ